MLRQLSKHKYTQSIRNFSHKHSVKNNETKLCKNCKHYEPPNFYEHDLEFYPIETLAKCNRFRVPDVDNAPMSAWNCRTGLLPFTCGPKGLFFEPK